MNWPPLFNRVRVRSEPPDSLPAPPFLPELDDVQKDPARWEQRPNIDRAVERALNWESPFGKAACGKRSRRLQTSADAAFHAGYPRRCEPQRFGSKGRALGKCYPPGPGKRDQDRH